MTAQRAILWTVVLGLHIGMPSGATAAAMPAQHCAVAKLEAAAEKNIAKLRCYQRSLRTGSAVDPACLTAAEQRFADRFARIEAKGGCGTSGDVAAVETSVDRCVGSLVSLLPATITTTTAPVCPTITTSTTTTSTTNPDVTTTTAPPSAVCTNLGGACGSCGSGQCVEVVAPIGACIVPTAVGPCAAAPPLCTTDDLARDTGSGCFCYTLCF